MTILAQLSNLYGSAGYILFILLILLYILPIVPILQTLLLLLIVYPCKSFWLWPTLLTSTENLSGSFGQFKEVWSSEQYDPCQSLVAKVNDDIEEAKPANDFEQLKHRDGSDMLSKGTCQKRSQDVRRWRRRRRRRRPASWWGSLRRRIPIIWRRYGE